MSGKKSDMVQVIYNDLKKKILSGELAHDERLVEVTTAEAYEASRLHAKEAFRLLEMERLVKHKPHRGFIVRGLTTEMIHEIIEIRQALEKVIFKEIIETATDEQLADVARKAKRFEVFVRSDMTEDAYEELKAMYEEVYALSAYKRIIKILDQYEDYIDLIRKMTIMTKEALEEGVDNFNHLASALVARDLKEVEHQLDLRHTYLKEND